MKYICSATIKHLPEPPEGWLGFMVGVLQFNAEKIEVFQQAVPQVAACHRFKICLAFRQCITYLFKITQRLEVFTTLLPAVALEQYASEKAQEALQGISKKVFSSTSTGDKAQ